MQGLEGGRGPPADSGRNRTRREETNDGVFDRRAGETFNGYGYTYNRTHGGTTPEIWPRSRQNTYDLPVVYTLYTTTLY